MGRGAGAAGPRGGTRPGVAGSLAGAFVGLAFQAKMAAAWLVLPALGVAFLVAGPGTWPRRVGATAAAGAVTAVVSLAWTVAVSLVPAASRPWVDGSTDDSLLQQIFVYNGLGRLGAQNPLQELAGQGLAVTAPGTGAEGPSVGRLFVGDLGRSAGWLLPAAVLAVVVGLWAVRHAPRTDLRRASYLLFGLWLLAYGVAFSAGAVVNVYYAASLVPAVAGVLGVAFVHLREARDTTGARAAAALGVVVTVAYGAALVLHSERPLVTPVVVAVVLGLVAVGLVVGRARGAPSSSGWWRCWSCRSWRRRGCSRWAAGRSTPRSRPHREVRAVRVLLVAAPRFAASTLPGAGAGPGRRAGPDGGAVLRGRLGVRLPDRGTRCSRSAGSPGRGRRRRWTSCAPTSPRAGSTWCSRSRAPTRAGVGGPALPGAALEGPHVPGARVLGALRAVSPIGVLP